MSRIFVYCTRPVSGTGARFDDVQGFALAQDGEVLVEQISASVEAAKRELGYTSKAHHTLYARKYPNYRVEWVKEDQFLTNTAFMEAIEKSERKVKHG